MQYTKKTLTECKHHQLELHLTRSGGHQLISLIAKEHDNPTYRSLCYSARGSVDICIRPELKWVYSRHLRSPAGPPSIATARFRLPSRHPHPRLTRGAPTHTEGCRAISACVEWRAASPEDELEALAASLTLLCFMPGSFEQRKPSAFSKHSV
jgi:hypothetical protein